MNQQEKPFSFKSIDDIYNFVEVGNKNNQNPSNVIRPENINVVKDDDSEIVLLMSYKKGNQQSPRYSDKIVEQTKNGDCNSLKLASTIKYLTKGIISDETGQKSDSLEQNIRGIFNNSQNPYFKPPTTNIDDIRSTDTLNSIEIRKITDNSKYSTSFDEKIIKPLASVKSKFWDTKTKIPMPERLKSREKKSNMPVSAGKPPETKLPDKQRYFALCVPSMINDPSKKFDIETHFQNVRYFNPTKEEFKKPKNNEIVVVPVNLLAKDENKNLVAGDSNPLNTHKPNDKIELTLEELHTIVKLVKERNTNTT